MQVPWKAEAMVVCHCLPVDEDDVLGTDSESLGTLVGIKPGNKLPYFYLGKSNIPVLPNCGTF